MGSDSSWGNSEDREEVRPHRKTLHPDPAFSMFLTLNPEP